MKNKYLKTLSILFFSLMLFSCEDFVNDYEQPNDSIGDDGFTDAGGAQFLMTGVEVQFSAALDRITSSAGAQSDEQGFTRDIQGASFPQFDELNSARRTTDAEGPELRIDNTVCGNLFLEVHEYRKHAELLLEKLDGGQIAFEAGEEAIQVAAYFSGNFHAGLSRYLLATYYALEPGQPGSTIDVGPFVPQAELYTQTLSYLNTALTFATEAEAKRVNTLIARINMIQGNYSGAATAAAAGMSPGDADYSGLYNVNVGNVWYFDSGIGRIQLNADSRFNDYLTADPAEEARVPLFTVPGTATDEEGNPLNTYYVQNKFTEQESPIRFLGWTENHYILAELDIRNGDNASGLAKVNEVRSSYGLSDLDDQYVQDNHGGDYISLIAEERDKEFFCEGMRLVDQRRLGLWHLDAALTWQYMPISLRERNQNENID